MAVTVTKGKKRLPGKTREALVPIAFTGDTSYQEGGEPLTFAQLGFRRVLYAIPWMTNGSEEATVRACSPYYTPATEKLHLIDNATGKEVASTKDMSKVKVELLVVGY